MQVVILAGGFGTRLGALTRHRPKVLVEVAGIPFVVHQLHWLARHGLRNVVLCVGHLAEQIAEVVKDGAALGMHVDYAYESPSALRGTAGALKDAAPLLDDQFFVLNGDSYLPVDPREPLAYFQQHRLTALMMTYKNTNQFDASNTAVRGGWVTFYSRGEDRKRHGVECIDYGLRLFRKEVLDLIPSGRHVDLDTLYHALIDRRELAAYETREPFYEIGSPEGLARFEQALRELEPGMFRKCCDTGSWTLSGRGAFSKPA